MHILLIEDKKELAEVLQTALSFENHTVDICHTGKQGIQKATTKNYDAILLDFKLPDLQGDAVCVQLKAHKVKTPVVLMSAYDEERVNTLDCAGYLEKPFRLPTLLETLKNITS